MENSVEMSYWLRDAEDALKTMQTINRTNYRSIIQNAQMAIESSAKAIISCFSAIEWTHGPAKQLLGIIELHKEKIIQKFGEKMFEELKTIVEDVKIAAPWHGKSVYGDFDRRIPAVELCTEDIARDLSNRAERTFMTAKKFLTEWFGEKQW